MWVGRVDSTRKNFSSKSKSSPKKKKGSRRGLTWGNPLFPEYFLIVQKNYEIREVEYPMCVPGKIFRAIEHDIIVERTYESICNMYFGRKSLTCALFKYTM